MFSQKPVIICNMNVKCFFFTSCSVFLFLSSYFNPLCSKITGRKIKLFFFIFIYKKSLLTNYIHGDAFVEIMLK